MILLLIVLITLNQQVSCEPRRVIFTDTKQQVSSQENSSKILVSITIKNNIFILPTFFGTIEQLTDKKNISLNIVIEENQAEIQRITHEWINKASSLFNEIKITDKNEELSISKLVQHSIERNYDYIFLTTSNSLLINSETLKILIKKRKSLVAPLLTSINEEYSTFSANFDDFIRIYNRQSYGCFKVPRISECLLLDLHDSDVVKIISSKSINNLIDFSNEALEKNLLLHVCNREYFGHIIKLDDLDNSEDKEEKVMFFRNEHLLNNKNKNYNEPLPLSNLIQYNQAKSKLEFDKIYIINLERRQDRRERITAALNDLKIDFEIFTAIDAKAINETYIKQLGISILPGYKDPYHDRPLNYGEIGCFLSHYFIWLDAIKNNYEKIVILEDDARFHFKFRTILQNLMNDIKEKQFDWDLIYLGRKVMRSHTGEEYLVSEISNSNGYSLIKPSYSHWTVAYLLSLEGAKKLVNEEPLKKLVPVDEYLPIMFDRQPNDYWISFFNKRNLNAFAVYPSIISPTHYFGEPNYISDTENTKILSVEDFKIQLDLKESSVHIEL